MKITVLGTGAVGRTLASAFKRLGHQVVVGTRNPDATRARDEWTGLDLELVRFSQSVDRTDVVVNATNGQASLEAIGRVGPERLAGTVLLDVANPLDSSAGFPPTLTVKDTDSLAEQIQRAAPKARVVKTLNTVNHLVMVDPERLAGESTIFVAGDDADARAVAVRLLRELGWSDIVELDELSAARGLEMWLPLWVRLKGTFGTADFNLRLVR